MTLTFKLCLVLFLFLSAGDAFRLHDRMRGIEEESARQDENELSDNPLALEKGSARLLGETPRLGGGRVLAAARGSAKPTANFWNDHFLERLWHADQMATFVGTKEWRRRYRINLKRARKLKSRSLRLTTPGPNRPKERRLTDARKLFSDDGFSNNAAFLQMMHDRQSRFAKLNIKEVPVHGRTPKAPSKKAAVSAQRKLALKKTEKAPKKQKVDKKKANKQKEVKKKTAKKEKKLQTKTPAPEAGVATPPAATQPVTAPVPALTVQPSPPMPLVTPSASSLVMNGQVSLDRSLEDEEKKAQNFVSDLQSQIRQTRLAVENIQDKLILIKENEGEIKAMVGRLLNNRSIR